MSKVYLVWNGRANVIGAFTTYGLAALNCKMVASAVGGNYRIDERELVGPTEETNTRPADPLPDQAKVMKLMAEALKAVPWNHPFSCMFGHNVECFCYVKHVKEALDAYSKLTAPKADQSPTPQP